MLHKVYCHDEWATVTTAWRVIVGHCH